MLLAIVWNQYHHLMLMETTYYRLLYFLTNFTLLFFPEKMMNQTFCLFVVLMVIVALTAYAEANPQFFGGGFGGEGGFRRGGFGGFGGFGRGFGGRGREGGFGFGFGR